MAKYIIEIEDEPLTRQSALHGEDAVYRAKGFNSLVFDQNGLEKLCPFTVDGTYRKWVTDTQRKYEATIKQICEDKKADIEAAKREAYDRGYAQGSRSTMYPCCPNCIRKGIQPLTDKERRIFLAAMAREEKVCKQVDDERRGELYEDSLVWVCHEIMRKVKAALWAT